ncbi:unnamed protein product [Zymoseptoria tritici ST99CH_3D7]|uniref:Uncharacterized protein n=1 Tax=Zymoseptoria tritici (strain ST99CH_3D7) TaxID=1276538 RepID=A0A1X7RPF6_ZYMT9|nr:unnamed protein product [Zymoseptoria tritici ST99CH_3D7]
MPQPDLRVSISLVGSQLYSHRISVCTLPTFVGLNAVSYITGHAPAMSADYDEYFTTHVTTDHGASEAVLNSQTSDPSSSNN